MHVLESPFFPGALHGHAVAITVLLLLVLGGVSVLGFSEAVGVAIPLVAVFLALNAVVVVNGLEMSTTEGAFGCPGRSDRRHRAGASRSRLNAAEIDLPGPGASPSSSRSAPGCEPSVGVGRDGQTGGACNQPSEWRLSRGRRRGPEQLPRMRFGTTSAWAVIMQQRCGYRT